MTKAEFKEKIPKMNKCQLKELGFDGISPIKGSSRPITLWIPEHLYDSIPNGFPILCWQSGNIELFNPDKHEKVLTDSGKFLKYALERKDIDCKNK